MSLLRKFFGIQRPPSVQQRIDASRLSLRPRQHTQRAWWQWCSYRRPMTLLLPATLAFTISGIAYTFHWSNERSKAGPCVDCARQRAIAEDIYFSKRPLTATSRGSCL